MVGLVGDRDGHGGSRLIRWWTPAGASGRCVNDSGRAGQSWAGQGFPRQRRGAPLPAQDWSAVLWRSRCARRPDHPVQGSPGIGSRRASGSGGQMTPGDRAGQAWCDHPPLPNTRTGARAASCRRCHRSGRRRTVVAVNGIALGDRRRGCWCAACPGLPSGGLASTVPLVELRRPAVPGPSDDGRLTGHGRQFDIRCGERCRAGWAPPLAHHGDRRAFNAPPMGDVGHGEALHRRLRELVRRWHAAHPLAGQ